MNGQMCKWADVQKLAKSTLRPILRICKSANLHINEL